MTITPLDIRKQDFSRSFRGYDIDEVEAFLQLIANQWQEMSDEARRLKDDLRASELKLDHYRKVEEALEEALQTARGGARQTIENAERKARSIIDLAESRALSITQEAENERLDTRREAARYSARQHEIVAKMRAFLMSEMEILAGYESDQSLVDRTPREALVEAVISDAEDDSIGSVPTDGAGDTEQKAEVDSTPETVQASDTVETTEDSSSDNGSDAEHEDTDDEEADSSSTFVFESETREVETVSTEHPAWRVTPIISLESDDPSKPLDTGGESDSDEVATEEIKKIRQILEDLEK